MIIIEKGVCVLFISGRVRRIKQRAGWYWHAVRWFRGQTGTRYAWKLYMWSGSAVYTRMRGYYSLRGVKLSAEISSVLWRRLPFENEVFSFQLIFEAFLSIKVTLNRLGVGQIVWVIGRGLIKELCPPVKCWSESTVIPQYWDCGDTKEHLSKKHWK